VLLKYWVTLEYQDLLYKNPKGNRIVNDHYGEKGMIKRDLHFKDNWELLK